MEKPEEAREVVGDWGMSHPPGAACFMFPPPLARAPMAALSTCTQSSGFQRASEEREGLQRLEASLRQEMASLQQQVGACYATPWPCHVTMLRLGARPRMDALSQTLQQWSAVCTPALNFYGRRMKETVAGCTNGWGGGGSYEESAEASQPSTLQSGPCPWLHVCQSE